MNARIFDPSAMARIRIGISQSGNDLVIGLERSVLRATLENVQRRRALDGRTKLPVRAGRFAEACNSLECRIKLGIDINHTLEVQDCLKEAADQISLG